MIEHAAAMHREPPLCCATAQLSQHRADRAERCTDIECSDRSIDRTDTLTYSRASSLCLLTSSLLTGMSDPTPAATPETATAAAAPAAGSTADSSSATLPEDDE